MITTLLFGFISSIILTLVSIVIKVFWLLPGITIRLTKWIIKMLWKIIKILYKLLFTNITNLIISYISYI
ncbi:MAG: hypothetical protein QXF12_04240 [Candidatus Aenigmatarchaeota archaeon]